MSQTNLDPFGRQSPNYIFTGPTSPTQLGGLQVINIGAGTTMLSASQAQALVLIVTGNLSSNAVLQVPATQGAFYTINNQTTGAGSLTVQPVGGSGFAIPQGTVTMGYVDNNGNFQSV